MGDVPVRIWEMKSEFGARIDLYSNGKLLIWFDPTWQVALNTGAGPRENTQNLYGYVEITPRPASGTRALDRSSAPTQLQE